MADYKHIFGGMAGGLIALALYVVLWANVQRCFGANAPYTPQSGECVIVNDIEFVVIAKEDWRRWTNAVQKLEMVANRRMKQELSTESGRRLWHGALKERRVTEAGIEIVYEDGYIHRIPAAPRKETPAVRRMKQAATMKPKPDRRNLPARLREKRDAMDARPAAKEVNAVFGGGGKLLKVEGAK